MESEKITLNRLPYRGLKKITDLVIFDRIILSLFKNKNNDNFLLYLVDEYEEYDEYIFWKVELIDLYTFFYKRISLKDLILVKNKEFIFVVHSDLYDIKDFESKESYSDIFQIFLSEVEEDWLPKEDSYWDYAIPFVLGSTLDEFAKENYLATLRENSVYFIIEPKDSKYLTTVTTYDITSFLEKLTNSYMAFIEFDFRNKFQKYYIEEESYQNSLVQLKSAMLPRVADTKFGSFEIGLSVDFQYPLIQENLSILNWQKTAIDTYKLEVLNVNYDSFQEVNQVVEKYPLPVRRAIFKPVYEIMNNQRYTVKSTNRLKTYFDKLPSITNDARRIILPPVENEPEPEPEPYELVTALFTVKQGTDISEMDKRTFRKRLLAVSKSDTSETQRQESFEYKGRYFNAIAPLTLRFATKGLISILICDALSIEVNSIDNAEIYRNLEKEIYEYYISKVINNPRSPEAKIFDIYFSIE